MIKKFSDLKTAAKEKDLDAARVVVKGCLSRSRTISGKFPAAQGSPLVRLNVAQLKNHRFEIKDTTSGEGETAKTVHTLFCTSMERRGTDFEIAQFSDRDRAVQALDAIDCALHSKRKKILFLGVSAVVLWMVLFMPLPHTGGQAQVRQPQVNPASIGMQQHLPLPMPSAGIPAPMPSMGGLPLPSMAPGAAQVPGAAPIPQNQSTPLAGPANDEDPFGLKIGPTGGSAGGPLQQQR